MKCYKCGCQLSTDDFCPSCGAEAVSWEGAHGYLAYWQRDRRLGGGHAGHLPGSHAPAR